MIHFRENGSLTEEFYDIRQEPQSATLFTTGNGYMGVRGSFEEFGATRIQGFFIRGLIDEIIEIVEPFCDNIYMRKYYFDEEKLKKFDRQDSCINLADILLVRISVGGKPFFPWEGEILAWERELNPATGILSRRVVWNDGTGNITEFRFERFASYADVHKYCLRAEVIPKNHCLPVEILSGIDGNVRTNGQIVTSEISNDLSEGIFYDFSIGKKYGFTVAEGVRNNFSGEKGYSLEKQNRDGLLFEKAVFAKGGVCCLEKGIYISTSRDEKAYRDSVRAFCRSPFSYEREKALHLSDWRKLFENFDIRIEGDSLRDSALRYANYQTVISAPPDSVHSLSAKGLTGEKYNQFVWWDCEIYQLPVFTYAYPQVTKNALEYRYKFLERAKENAAAEGRRGARYPFVSSVDGREHVWIYARHPFLQIHINSDIAYCILRYYEVTGDHAFMQDMGVEMLVEICRYWVDRMTFRKDRYEILNVTGTDEHHPYVDNDAYTNYCVKIVFDGFLKICVDEDLTRKAFKKTGFGREELEKFRTIDGKIYLPCEPDGKIPQFDGYFGLSEKLEITGFGTGKDFQMKESGLYHKSQIIKQPDVMLLFSYIDCPDIQESFSVNWSYYEKLCENSSSLSFPPHAVCAAREGSEEKFLCYFDDCVLVDIKDIFKTAYQGLHSGCMAGGWYSIVKGLFGWSDNNGQITLAPFRISRFKKVSVPIRYRGNKLVLEYDDQGISLYNFGTEAVTVTYADEAVSVKAGRKKCFAWREA